MNETHYRNITVWLIEQIRAGQPTQVLLQAMCDRGWRRDVAMGLIAQAMGERSEPVAMPASPDSPQSVASTDDGAVVVAKSVPAPAIDDGALYVDVGDRRVPVLMHLPEPRIVLFGDFLSKQECDRLVEAARPRMQRSMTADPRTGETMVDTVRTSRGMFFHRDETPLVRTIKARIAKLLRWPVSHGEHLQVLHYRPGDRYEPHYDYFDPTQPGAAPLLARGGQRLATFLMYLREPERGGDTTFPDIGLSFAPKRGSALFFSYPVPDPSSKSLHGGAPVQAGEKWVATKWLREGVFA
jgi:prolyl 4-hydroxylase